MLNSSDRLIALYAPCACLHAGVQSSAKDLNKYVDEGPGHGIDYSGSLLPSKEGRVLNAIQSCFGLPDGGYHQYPYSSLHYSRIDPGPWVTTQVASRPQNSIIVEGRPWGEYGRILSDPPNNRLSAVVLLSYELVKDNTQQRDTYLPTKTNHYGRP